MTNINDIRVRDQYRIIHDPKDGEGTKIPQMPLLVVLDNEIIGETNSIRGAATIVIGNEYLDAEDAFIEWHMRLETARREAMKALKDNIEVLVCDSRKGIIPNNYASGPNDPDYIIEDDEEIGTVEKVYVDSDRLFLLSLAKIGAIRILEREDSYLLRPHEKWVSIKNNGGEQKSCGNCLYKIDSEGEILCPVYRMRCKESDGSDCQSFAIVHDGVQREYTGGVYIDICMEYDIDELMEMFGVV